MEINYEITEKDYVNYNLYSLSGLKNKNNHFIMRYCYPIAVGFILFMLLFLIFDKNIFAGLFSAIISVVFILFWIINYEKIYKKSIADNAMAVLKKGDNSFILGKRTMIISEDDLKVISDYSTTIVLKEGIKDIKVYEDMILIYLSFLNAIIIPTRSLTEEIKEEFLEKITDLKKRGEISLASMQGDRDRGIYMNM